MCIPTCPSSVYSCKSSPSVFLGAPAFPYGVHQRVAQLCSFVVITKMIYASGFFLVQLCGFSPQCELQNQWSGKDMCLSFIAPEVKCF